MNDDILCTTTAARDPILQADCIKLGAHINAVGAGRPTTRELDSQTVLQSIIFIDCRESALNEAGELMIPIAEGLISQDHVVGEVGEVLLGKIMGRTRGRDITVFKSLGIAVEDIVAAHHIYLRAQEKDVGIVYNFEGRSE